MVSSAPGDFASVLGQAHNGDLKSVVFESVDVSDEKATAGRLRESQRLLDAAQIASHVGSFELDLNSNVMAWSDEQFRIFGHEPGSIHADRDAFLRAVHPEDRDRVDSKLRDVGSDDGHFLMECRTLRPDGTVHWIRGWGEFLPEDGTKTHLVASVQDITERRAATKEHLRMERDLRESAELFEGAFTAAQTGIALTDAESGAYIDVNAALCEMLGYPKDELMALDRFAVTHPEDRESSHQLMGRFIDGNQKIKFVRKRYLRKDGAVIIVEISEALMRGPDGEPLHFVSHITDVTEAEESARALKESRELLKAVVDNSPAVIYIKHADGHYLMANNVFLDVFGFEKEQVIGHTDHEIFATEIADRLVVNDLAVLQNGPMRVEESAPHADGTIHQYISVKFPLTGARGATEVCGISTDVTDRVEAKDEKQRLQGQLVQAQKMEAVGQLAGGVAHDFNNILSVILNYAQFVSDDMEADDVRRADLQEIITAGQSAAQLVHQLLAFSRKEIIEPKVVDLGQVVRTVQGLLERSIGEDIALEITTVPDLWLTKSDTGQLEQVLMNLVVNARDAMPQGGAMSIATGNESIGVDARLGLRAGNYARLKVTDSGSGMDAATADRIFEPFFTTKDRGQGTGLGLATVYGIVKQAGGGIYVDSELGRGTSFSVYLPATDEMSSMSDGDHAAGGAVEESATILVVEDEAVVRNLVARILTKHGFEVVAVASGSAALDYCQSHGQEIDLLLTDVIMPEMSGKILADQFGADSDARVLYMSGYTDEIIAKRGVLGGNESLIEKPFTAQALVAKVRSVLRERRPA